MGTGWWFLKKFTSHMKSAAPALSRELNAHVHTKLCDYT